MPRTLILIKDLVKGNQVLKMHIRVVDMWVVKGKNGSQHLELVLQNGMSDQIHVTSRSQDFKDLIEQLKEHETYYIYNGEFVLNDGPFKVCSNQLKLVFNSGNTVTNVAISEIPAHIQLSLYLKLSQWTFKPDILYDVIGVLQDVVKTQIGGGGKKSCVNITLRDI
ncbi:hypothetical protein RYX36_020588 [Vicia faba]